MSRLETVSRLLGWTAQRSADRTTTKRRISELLQRSCPNLHQLQVVKVAGTNGKGSVCAMLEVCLKAGGKTVGLFTSPHLQRVTERIRVNGSETSTATLEAYASRLEPLLRDLANERGPDYIPSFFEILLLIAIRIFLDAKVEYAVFEAGIGGGRDATAQLPGRIATISSLSYDHEAKLGSSLSEIADEKARIATEKSTLVLGPRVGEHLVKTIRRALSQLNVRIVQATRHHFVVKKRAPFASVIEVQLTGQNLEIELPLPADYQIDNLATALAVLENLAGMSELSIRAALCGAGNINWPGRFEHIEGSPSWLLDGAHNEEGIDALISGIGTHFATRDRTLIYGTSKDKSYSRYLARLPGIAKRAYVTDDFHNAEDRNVLAAALPESLEVHLWASSIKELIHSLRRRTDASDELVVVTGSLFLVGEVRRALGLGRDE